MTIIMNPGAPTTYTPPSSGPARQFTPGRGGYGIISRRGEGDPRYYGDYTEQELGALGGRVDARTPIVPGTPLAAAIAAGRIQQFTPHTGGAFSLNLGRSNFLPGSTPTPYTIPLAQQRAFQNIANRF